MSPKTLLYLLFILKIVLPFFIQDGYYQPHRDEFLYLAEGHHLAWGYMEVPPVLSLFSWLINFLGGGHFWIKFFPDLAGGFCFLLMGRMILHLKGGKFALFLAFLPFIFGAYLRAFFLFQPNFIEIFSWALIGYTLIRYLQTNGTKYLYLFGLSVGVGMLSKYTVAFYTISLLGGLLLTRQRRIFLQPHLYGGALLALLIFLPNLLWQYNHNFPVIAHMDELKETQLQYINTGTFIREQFMMFLPVVFVWVAGLTGLAATKTYAPFKFYAWAYVILVALMIYFKGKGYYILGVYPMLFVFGATWLEKLTMLRFRWTRYAMSVVAIGLGLVALPLLLPVAPPEKLTKYYEAIGSYKAGDFKWEDLKAHPLPQDFADMMGWREITEKTAGVYGSLSPEQQSKTIIIGSSYAIAGALNHYGPALGLPESYSANASFLLWMPETYQFDNMIYIDDRLPKEIELFNQFQHTTTRDSVNLPMFRENGVKVFLFEGANDTIRAGITELIRQRKKRFQR